jgi:stage II sporulation protein D
MDHDHRHAVARIRSGVRAAAGLAALVGAIAGVGPASGAQPVGFTFYGRGFGHGIGLSQYGAEGAAAAGWNASRILAWFYRGTTVTRLASPTVRIQLTDPVVGTSVGTSGGGTLVDVVRGTRRHLIAGAAYSVRMSGSQVVVTSASGAVVDRASGGVHVVPASGSLVSWSGRRYRGLLTLSPAGRAVRVVNVVPIEQYLRGVVPSEMASSWRLAALQAQAIASRTYAIHGIRRSAPFDLFADSRSQAYGGVAAEASASDLAVRTTAGQVVTAHGAVIEAVFASSDGGYTESVQNVWGGPPESYLVGVSDPFDAASPSHRWSRPPTFTGAQLGGLLRTGGSVTGIDVLARGISPRVISVRVALASGAHRILTGGAIAADLNLQSTWFWIGRSDGPTPLEPHIAGGQIPPPEVGPPGPGAAAPARGGWMVAVGTTPRLGDARRLARRVERVAPGTQIITRRPGGHAVFLVIAIRVGTRRQAGDAQVRLAAWGFRARVMRAGRHDPSARPVVFQHLIDPGAPTTAAAPPSMVPNGGGSPAAAPPPPGP